MKRMAVLLVVPMLFGVLGALAATPAEGTTWYNTCGPKINIRAGMSNVQTIRHGYVVKSPVTYLKVTIKRGLKSGMGQTGIWWARMDQVAGAGPIRDGDFVDLYWTDYEPANKANYCRDDATPLEPFALTWGINSVYSSSNQAHRRLFAATGFAISDQEGGGWVTGFANLDQAGHTTNPWVVSY